MLKRIAWLQTSGILRGDLFGEIFGIDRGELSESSSCTRRCHVTNEWNPPKFLTSVPTQNVDFAELTDTERILNVLLRKKKKRTKRKRSRNVFRDIKTQLTYHSFPTSMFLLLLRENRIKIRVKDIVSASPFLYMVSSLRPFT